MTLTIATEDRANANAASDGATPDRATFVRVASDPATAGAGIATVESRVESSAESSAEGPAEGRAEGRELDPLTEADHALARLASIGPGDPARDRLREQIICQCAPAARREAGRYRHTGESMEDLVQVATVGLIHAVDRFDPARSVPFRHFAMPTITGELKRHFRDKGWSVRVSRRIQELHQEVSRAEPELAQRLARTPTVADLAAHLSLTEEEVLAGRGGGAAYSTRSLNWRVHGDDDMVELGDLIGAEDRDLEAIADRESLRQALLVLPDRLRLLLSLRFVDNLTQSQIADRIGVSQMHVSRLISRALAILRRHMLAERPAAAPDPPRRKGTPLTLYEV